MKKILIALPCLLLLSCTREADIKLPETEPKLVLYSYICPEDSLITLALTYSQPLYTKTGIDPGKPVTDAEVRVSGPSGSFLMKYNIYTFRYELSTQTLPVVPGGNYQVQVKAKDGKEVRAETQVPVKTININTVTATNIQEQYGQSKEFKVRFNDEPGVANFYRLAFSITQVWMGDTMSGDAGMSLLYSDNGHDGVETIMSQRVYSPPDSNLVHIDLLLVNCSKAYYQFQQSLNNYTYDDPFSEPSFIYSNVEGGFGVFAGYAKSHFRYKP